MLREIATSVPTRARWVQPSRHSGRGPFVEGGASAWRAAGYVGPVCTAYKIVSIRLDYAFGVLERHVPFPSLPLNGLSRACVQPPRSEVSCRHALAALQHMYLKNFTGMHALAVAQLDEWWGVDEAAMRDRAQGWLLGGSDAPGAALALGPQPAAVITAAGSDVGRIGSTLLMTAVVLAAAAAAASSLWILR
jgi:hypothetical protein